MQNINLNKTLDLGCNVEELLLISIDDQIDSINDKDGIKIEGKINISGKIKTDNIEKDFYDTLDLDIFFAYDEIIDRNNLNVSVNDFTYKIEDNKLQLSVFIKIDGLKEIETTFLSQKIDEIVFEEQIEDDEKRVYIDENIEIINDELKCSEIKNDLFNVSDNENIEEIKEENDNDIVNETIDDQSIEQNEEEISFIENNSLVEEVINEANNNFDNEITEDINCYDVHKKEQNCVVKKSLLKSIFASKRIKEEISWKLHCVRGEKEYKEIAVKYNVNLDKLVSINKNEPLEDGKLIFLPLD